MTGLNPVNAITPRRSSGGAVMNQHPHPERATSPRLIAGMTRQRTQTADELRAHAEKITAKHNAEVRAKKAAAAATPDPHHVEAPKLCEGEC
jgi:hypothetical protein